MHHMESALAAGTCATDIRDQARNAANPQGQMQASQQIAALLAQDPDIKRAIGDDPLEKHQHACSTARLFDRTLGGEQFASVKSI